MATRVVEWKKPYTWWKAISIDENKVISLNLRDENNLIIYDEWDDEIYVDLQLDDEITPQSAFPIWVNTGRVIVDNWWDKTWTIICAKTTSGDNIKLFYADEGTLWIDNWTGTFKQIYFKADVDALLLALRNYIDWELAKKQNWVSSDTAPEDPVQWDLWYDTINDVLMVYDGSQWSSTGDVLISQDTGNLLTAWDKLWLWTESDFSSIVTKDSNTLYIQYKSDWGWGWQPWASAIAYYPLTNDLNDVVNNYNMTNSGVTFSDGVAILDWNQMPVMPNITWWKTVAFWFKKNNDFNWFILARGGTDKYIQLRTNWFAWGWSWWGTFNADFLAWWSTPSNVWRCCVISQTVANNSWAGTWEFNIYLSDFWWVSGIRRYDGSSAHYFNRPLASFWWSGDPSFPYALIGNVSKLVVDANEWSLLDCEDFYDQTKADYWIS